MSRKKKYKIGDMVLTKFEGEVVVAKVVATGNGRDWYYVRTDNGKKLIRTEQEIDKVVKVKYNV